MTLQYVFKHFIDIKHDFNFQNFNITFTLIYLYNVCKKIYLTVTQNVKNNNNMVPFYLL